MGDPVAAPAQGPPVASAWARKISLAAAFPLRIGWAESGARYRLRGPGGGAPIDRVGRRMHPDIGVGMALQTAVMGDGDAAEHHVIARAEPVTSYPLPERNIQFCPLTDFRPGKIGPGWVILKLSSSPGTMATSSPAARATSTSSAAPPGWASCAARIASVWNPCGVWARYSPGAVGGPGDPSCPLARAHRPSARGRRRRPGAWSPRPDHPVDPRPRAPGARGVMDQHPVGRTDGAQPGADRTGAVGDRLR